jgi:periplasmic protein TonB
MMGTFLDEKRRSPASLMVVIALHGAALTALLMAKTHFEVRDDKPLFAKPIRETLPPPEAEVPPPPETKQLPKETVTFKPPIVDLPNLPDVPVERTETKIVPLPQPLPPLPTPDPPMPKAEPKAEPVRIAARIDARSNLQPPYPASEQRAGREGVVTVRVTIGPDGRVVAVEKVSATSDDFWRATERQALRAWRFKPATLDGKPVTSTQTLTVRFELDTRDA